jgi:predicted acylesterase/phospholipase RssA
LPERLPPVPPEATLRAQPLGIPNARFYPIGQIDQIIEEGRAAMIRRLVAQGLMKPGDPVPASLPPVQFLGISGGGDDGAFGAGLLVGWTEAGNRPEFQMVTGVSTGALIAPFAYLGPAYDRELREVYTTITPESIFRLRGLPAALFDDALADTAPLWRLISRHLDERMLVEIARNYQSGRLLMIGTTNLDAQLPVVWNIGAIAASGHPGALDLVRKILRASSAIPGLFQPVLIDVEVDGQHRHELHVDGGAIAQLFVYPPTIELRKYLERERSVYLIRNARQDEEWAEVQPRTLSIAGRAIATMIHSGGSNDIARIYFITQRDRVDFNLAYIGREFSFPHETEFDRAYMNALFNYGYEQARKGYDWKKELPGLLGKP